ncbi:MAG TPA: aspartate ammonia-lyase [Spirochaetia bacterium]|nr:aspartate ammonia-lyase [Spirochaetia bacterium]
MDHRSEEDLLGIVQVPAEAYWGAHTERARANFPLSGYRVHPRVIRALALVKKACCLANTELGLLAPAKGEAIVQACDEVANGGLQDQFPVDALQGGAGTSTNMNVNEVIANRAAELLGGVRGDYSRVHPIEDVNLNQSTNDTYPTALKVSAIMGLRRLSDAIAGLQGAFQEKEKELAGIVTIGRTELQEAVPMTLGAEFSGFAEAMSRDRWRTFKCEERLRVVNIGGTAVGTGISAPRSYIFLVVERLRDVTGLGLARGENLVDQTANSDSFVEVSGILKAHAASLVKICNDLRVLGLLGEIRVPAVQAGSSVMPGKVNPVLLEAGMQVGMKVMANDLLIAEACSRGSLQITEFLPLVSFALHESLDLLANVDTKLTDHVRGLQADEARCRSYFEKSPMIVTALLPRIGYDKATDLLQQFLASGRENILDFLDEKLGEDLVRSVFSPQNLVALGYKDGSS